MANQVAQFKAWNQETKKWEKREEPYNEKIHEHTGHGYFVDESTVVNKVTHKDQLKWEKQAKQHKYKGTGLTVAFFDDNWNVYNPNLLCWESDDD
jgi:ribosomal protein S1